MENFWKKSLFVFTGGILFRRNETLGQILLYISTDRKFLLLSAIVYDRTACEISIIELISLNRR